MTDVKETDDRKRAAALADDIEAAFNRLPYEAMGAMLAANGTSIVRALRAYADPAVSADLRERVARAQPDWWWCDIDPDECGDTPYEAMFQHRQRLVPVELSSSYVGPKYWGVMSPPVPGADDGSETDHVFDTLEEAQAFCAERRAALATGSGHEA